MAKSEKVAAVAEIAEQFKSSTATVVTEYRGLSVTQISTLRRSLGEGATYSVAKNTLVKRAAAEAGVEGLDELFTGPTAIAFIEGEPVVAAKAIKTFAKDNKALVIKGGYMDGRALSIAEIEQIAAGFKEFDKRLKFPRRLAADRMLDFLRFLKQLIFRDSDDP